MYKYSIIILLCLSFLSSCSQETGTPEEQIRDMISAIESAAEQRSLDSVKEFVSSTYQDEWHSNKRAALRSLMFYFQGHQNVHLLTRVSEIQINDESSTANIVVYVGMAGKRVEESQALLDLNADLYRFDIDLVLEDDDWRVKRARWQRARPDNFGL
jgi:hypothetical protein